MATKDSDNHYGRRASSNAFACVVLFLIVLVPCGFLWMSIRGNDIIHDTILEARESPAGYAAFGPVRDEIIALLNPYGPLQTTAEHSGILDYAPNCFEVEAKWLVPMAQPSEDFLRVFKTSKLLYGWHYSEGWLYAYHDYQYTSDDDRIFVLITYEKQNWSYSGSPEGYKIWLSYLSPSQTDCHA